MGYHWGTILCYLIMVQNPLFTLKNLTKPLKPPNRSVGVIESITSYNFHTYLSLFLSVCKAAESSRNFKTEPVILV